MPLNNWEPEPETQHLPMNWDVVRFGYGYCSGNCSNGFLVSNLISYSDEEEIEEDVIIFNNFIFLYDGLKLPRMKYVFFFKLFNLYYLIACCNTVYTQFFCNYFYFEQVYDL